MKDKNTPEIEDDEIEYVSRTALKKYMEELQALGKRLTELKPDQLAQIQMGDRLREAVVEMGKISANGAKKRHLGYIGKLMRHEDEEAIEAALDRFDSASDAHNQRFHRLERLREGLVKGDNSVMNDVLNSYPECDIQHLRALIRNAQKEREQNKPPANYRKIFQYLRELDEQI